MDTYIIVTTLCDKKEIANAIQIELLEKKLVSGCQLTTCESTYWWQGKIETATEYHLEMRSKKSLYPEIEKTIRFLHDYETAEISYCEIKGSTEFLNWIQSETTN